MQNREESGFVLLTLLVVLVPMLFVVGAYSVAMTGRSNELRVEINQERALLAAEAGVDESILRGRIGNLYHGVTFTGTLGTDLEYSVEPTYLLVDGLDNDGDLIPDDPDEDVFQVVVTGKYRRTTRVIAAYLGPVSLLPTINTAVGVQNPSVNITLNGTPQISGNNLNMNGTPTTPNVEGLSITTPGTTADLLAQLTAAEQALVVGASGPPSLGTIPPIDLTTLVNELQNVANLVLTSNMYASYNFGNGPGGIANITYRSGNVKFSGNSQGAGILVVTGDLTLGGTFRFDGVIIVLGNIVNNAGTVDVYGAILQGPAASSITMKGTMNVHYSSEAISLANSMGGRYVSFNGWQEIAN